MPADFRPYKIFHLDIRSLRPRRAIPADGPYYLVFWWGQTPLGHFYADALPSAFREDPLDDLTWKAVCHTLAYYCESTGRVCFQRLSACHEAGDTDACQGLLFRLFAAAPFERETLPALAAGVSLVICTRNRSGALERCLHSLQRLANAPREVIVVDNAPDDSQTRQLVADFPGVRYVMEPVKGLSHARNTGWQCAASDIVAFTDDDVQLHKDWPARMAAPFRDQRVQGVTGLVMAARLKTEAQFLFEQHWSFNRGYLPKRYDTACYRERAAGNIPAWEIGAGAAMAFRRRTLERLGGFDTRLDVGAAGCNGDSEMWYRIIAEGGSIHYTPLAVAYHAHRRKKKQFKRQIHAYMSGFTAALLIQYQRYRHPGNLYHLFRELPPYYLVQLYWGCRRRFAGRQSTLWEEVTGCSAGILYFLRHRMPPAVEPAPLPAPVPAEEPLVSVIITAYNQACYLPDSIGSVLQQTYRAIEIIIVDDGSSDNTAEVAAHYPDVRYIKQENRGLSAARNTGIIHSSGDYLVFLDADDLLYPRAVSVNLRHFKEHPDCAFVSGKYDCVNEKKQLLPVNETEPPADCHFEALLQGNYIGMHAAVMYRRTVFDVHLFDETLKACEDYDLYLRLAARYPVFSHAEKLTAYRLHDTNMSNDINLMLHHVKKVLRKSVALAREKSPLLHTSWHVFRKYYAEEVWKRMDRPRQYPHYRLSMRDMRLVLSVLPYTGIKTILYKSWDHIRGWIAGRIPLMIKRRRPDNFIPPPGKVCLGDLARTAPLSREFGYDRGGPVDRYYIEKFLAENAGHIRGRVLEAGDNDYTLRFGGDRVQKSDILYVDDSNPSATVIADLSNAAHIPPAQFDCIILTQTLHLIYHYQAALQHACRLLRPGGTLLLTVPGISPIDYGEWGDTWYWSFTGKAVQRMLVEIFPVEDIRVKTYGNVLAASAFLYGLGGKELTEAQKEFHDPHYQVVVAAMALKK